MHATFDKCSFNGNAAAGEGAVGDGVNIPTRLFIGRVQVLSQANPSLSYQTSLPWFLVIPKNYFSVTWTLLQPSLLSIRWGSVGSAGWGGCCDQQHLLEQLGWPDWGGRLPVLLRVNIDQSVGL